MKKIAFVIAELAAPGGAEKVAADLAVEFDTRGYEVVFITFDHPPEQSLDVVGRRIRVPLPQRSGGMLSQIQLLLQRAWAFHKIFRQEQFDHIFSFLEAANVPAAMASRDAVVSMHLNPDVMTSKEWWLVRWIYPRAKQVVAVSKNMQQKLEQVASLPNVSCIYNPVRTDYASQQAQQSVEHIPDKPFILAVGRLHKQKRFDRLIEAFAYSELKQDACLLIAGAGADQAKLAQQIVQLGVQDQVVLLGYQSNPYPYMAQARFLVMSSDYEGYPLTLIECLSLSCPAISMDCPTGPREIIDHEVNGLLVDMDEGAKGLAHAMDRLYYDTALYQQVRRQAAKSVHDNDIAPVADRWLAL